MDRELFYTGRIRSSRSVQTVRSVNPSLHSVDGFHGPYKTLRTETIVSRSVTVRVCWTTLG